MQQFFLNCHMLSIFNLQMSQKLLPGHIFLVKAQSFTTYADSWVIKKLCI